MKTRIDEELDKLDLGTMSLSTLVEEALGIITSSLNNSYGKVRIKEISQEIEEKSKSLESSCINLLLKFHPVARDLKRIPSTLCTIRDLSRIGDDSLDFCGVSVQAWIDVPLQGDKLICMIKSYTDQEIVNN